MALLDTLDKADASVGEPYEKMKQIFVELMDSMLKYQDESGMWYQVVNVGGMDRNYLETSGSSIMAYALLKGVRLGFLPESYRMARRHFTVFVRSTYRKMRMVNLFRRNLSGCRTRRCEQTFRNF